MRSLILSAAAAVAIVFGGAAAQAERLTEKPLVDAAWLSDNLENPSLVVVDIRSLTKEGSPYDAGHIPGAVFAPYGKFGWRAKVGDVVGQLPPVDVISARIGSLGIDNDKQVVVVPAGQNSSDFGSATRVYWTFKVLGHDAVTILDGGQRAWEAAGKPVSNEAVAPQTVAFNANFRPELLATADDVAKARENGVALVDARPVSQYKGESKSGVVARAGAIPGAVNISQSEFYNDQQGAFVASDVIEGLVENAGVAKDGAEITYCNTGHWASVAWFGLSEVMGNKNTRMYDGSMTEWAADPSREVVIPE
ncbi:MULTISPECIES: sulfurtransferase [Thalassospira]|jgi:thiosulfate/3-mercaptopyruvate sulfurtransferase|uniref:sulfurtransferase n=1 Tax=Thalassospira TaxID=168934 RepID=UPI000C4A9A79|nr:MULTISPECIES: sulfurtransferase [Thalassospira]MAZ32222.1 sulfurtransferase [Thalassospira sp.]MBO9508045.1 sulfurtransferase [Thalassospira sp. A3_1]MCK2166343.1 sulfurtransferase [Thalassospira xiamenensis]RCK31968.1 sulfurtransferase [Thalassospira xiamenensis]